MRHLVGLLAVLVLFVPGSSAAHLKAGPNDLYMRRRTRRLPPYLPFTPRREALRAPACGTSPTGGLP